MECHTLDSCAYSAYVSAFYYQFNFFNLIIEFNLHVVLIIVLKDILKLAKTPDVCCAHQ